MTAGVHHAHFRAAAQPARHDCAFLAVLEMIKMQASKSARRTCSAKLPAPQKQFNTVFASADPFGD